MSRLPRKPPEPVTTYERIQGVCLKCSWVGEAHKLYYNAKSLHDSTRWIRFLKFSQEEVAKHNATHGGDGAAVWADTCDASRWRGVRDPEEDD